VTNNWRSAGHAAFFVCSIRDAVILFLITIAVLQLAMLLRVYLLRILLKPVPSRSSLYSQRYNYGAAGAFGPFSRRRN
jgi:hypothetical protein